MIKNRYLLPFILTFKEQMTEVKWFSTFNVNGGFNYICIKEEDEFKTAF